MPSTFQSSSPAAMTALAGPSQAQVQAYSALIEGSVADNSTSHRHRVQPPPGANRHQSMQHGHTPFRKMPAMSPFVTTSNQDIVSRPASSFQPFHARGLTDPFVDNSAHQSRTPWPTIEPSRETNPPRCEAGNNRNDLPSHACANTLIPNNANGSRTPWNTPEQASGSWQRRHRYPNTDNTPTTPNQLPDIFHQPFHQRLRPTTPLNGSTEFSTFSTTPQREALFIPPPVLPAAINLTTTAPNQRDPNEQAARTAKRTAWIKNGAKHITQLMQNSIRTGQAYMSNPTLETFAAWEHDQRAYLAATNLDTWQQQRRELFMPEGAQALRIPLADVAGVEVMPGSIAHDGQGNRLLDFHMALSERFCHEVMAAEPRDGVAGENELTKEQWGVLDDEEKMMIKEWLKGRLARSVPVPP